MKILYDQLEHTQANLLQDVERFACSSQEVAYAGLDIEVKQSGKSKGQTRRVLAKQWEHSTDLV